MKNSLKDFLRITIPTFLILFVSLEMVVRVFYVHQNLRQLTGKEPTVNPMSQWAKPHPYACYTAIPGDYSKSKTVNSHGFISTPELPWQKPTNTTRILFMGGSSTAGTGFNLPDEQTWPWKTVEKIRSSSALQVDFINGALGGYTSFESYGRLWSELFKYEPDLLILNHGWNELYYFDHLADSIHLWRADFDLKSEEVVTAIAPAAIDPYIGWSQLLTKLRIRWSSKPAQSGELAKVTAEELSTNYNEKGLFIFRRNLRLIRDFCRRKGVRLAVCKQPTLMTATTSEEDRKRCRFSNHGFDYEAHLRAYEALYQVIEQEIPASDIIDLTPISGKPGYFYDHVHPTPSGTSAIASLVAQWCHHLSGGTTGPAGELKKIP
ncbi:MAG: SGNH/GDSL hydrolase family protein [Bacteroidota bacterium]